MQVKITPSPLAGTVQLPPSKSFAIRALICSALAGGGSVAPLGTSADIAATVQALADLAAGRDEIFCNEKSPALSAWEYAPTKPPFSEINSSAARALLLN